MPPASEKPFKRKRTCYVCGPTEKSVCRFPKETERLNQWCNFCNISPEKLLNSSRLCIEHFRETDLMYPSSDRPSLKLTAVPTMYTVNQLRRCEKHKRKRTCYVCGPTENSLCRFPREVERLHQWCNFCHISPDKLLNSSRLCIEHFRETDLICPKSDRPSLKSTAIPTVYTTNQLKRLKLSSPGLYDGIKCTENDVELSTSVSNILRSILSENTSIQNAYHVENLPATFEKKVFDDETTPMVFEHSSSSQRSFANDDECNSFALMAENISSDNSEITPADLGENDVLDNGEEICIDARCLLEVEMKSHAPASDEITNLPLTSTSQPVSPLNSPIIENSVIIEKSSDQPQFTPTVKNVSNQSRSRRLRFIGDIRSPDLETPRRRKECLKVIRYQNKCSKSKIRLLQRQNRRLKEEVKTLKQLVRELQEKNSSSAISEEIR